MRTLLLTGYDDNMKAVGDITSDVMRHYASKHSIDFLCIRQYAKDTHPSWQKAMHVACQLSNGYQRVIWLDADTLITNSDTYLDSTRNDVPPIEVSQDWGTDATELHHFNMGNFIANVDANELWAFVWKRYLPKMKETWGNAPLWEQSALQELYKSMKEPETIFGVYPRRMFNSVHSELAPSAPEPWQEGDWLCHLTGEEITNEKRMKMLQKLLPIIV